jgi:hypothetical protein
VIYDAAQGTFELPPEQAMVLAAEDSPVFVAGASESIASCSADQRSRASSMGRVWIVVMSGLASGMAPDQAWTVLSCAGRRSLSRSVLR